MTSWTVFWLIVFGKLWALTALIALIFGLLIAFLLSVWADDVGGKNIPPCEVKFPRYLGLASVGLLFFALLTFFLPNKKEVAAIYLIPVITESTQVQTITSQTGKVIEASLTSYLNSLTSSSE